RLYRQEQFESALTDLDAALSIEPDNARGLFYKGLVLTKFNRFDEAFQAFDRALEVQSIQYQPGDGRDENAEPKFQQDSAEEREETVPRWTDEKRRWSAEALGMRARMHRQFGRTDEAVSDFTMAMMFHPLIVGETIPALQIAGYWRSPETPDAITPELL